MTGANELAVQIGKESGAAWAPEARNCGGRSCPADPLLKDAALLKKISVMERRRC